MKKGKTLKVRSTEEHWCQFGFIHWPFFRGRRQGRQPLNASWFMDACFDPILTSWGWGWNLTHHGDQISAPRPCFPGFPKLKTAAPVGFSRPRLRQGPAMHFCDTDGPQWQKLTVTNRGLRGTRSGIAMRKNRQPIPKAQEMWVHKSGIEIPSSNHFHPVPPKDLWKMMKTMGFCRVSPQASPLPGTPLATTRPWIATDCHGTRGRAAGCPDQRNIRCTPRRRSSLRPSWRGRRGFTRKGSIDTAALRFFEMKVQYSSIGAILQLLRNHLVTQKISVRSFGDRKALTSAIEPKGRHLCFAKLPSLQIVESIAAQKLKLFSLETKWTTRFQHVPEAQGSRSELYTFSGDFAIFSHPHFSDSLMFHVILPVEKMQQYQHHSNVHHHPSPMMLVKQ